MIYVQPSQTNKQTHNFTINIRPPSVKYIHHQQWMPRIGVDKSVSQSSHFFKKNLQKGLNLLDNLYANVVNFADIWLLWYVFFDLMPTCAAHSLTKLAFVFLKNLMQKLSVKTTFLTFLSNIWLKIVFFSSGK